MKRPWRAHYTGDWSRDPFVRQLSLEARMVYFELLDIAWEEGGLRPEWVATGLYVAHRIGIGRAKFCRLFRDISVKFQANSDGFLVNPRMETERNSVENFSKKQSNNAKERYLEAARPPATVEPLALPARASSSQHFTSHEEPAAPSAPPLLLVPPPEPEAKKKAEPLPYTLATLQATLAETSAGRYVPFELAKGPAISAQRLIRRHTLAQVRVAGAWLAAGGEGWRGAIDARALGALPAWIAQAEAWAAAGRPAIDNRAGGQPRRGNDDPPPRLARDAAPGLFAHLPKKGGTP